MLVALNLYNKHAVGIIFERTDNNSFQIKYIDPMNKAISTELIQIIKNILANAEIKQISVELQKYANCGAEVIENFILYLTGTRVSQEKAIELHSKLVENKLLGNNQSNIHCLFKEELYSDHENYGTSQMTVDYVNNHLLDYHNDSIQLGLELIGDATI